MGFCRVLWLFLAINVLGKEANDTVDNLYTSGVTAYNKDKWFDCFENMKNVIVLQTETRAKIAHCHLTCSKMHNDKLQSSILSDVMFFNLLLKTSTCSRHCFKFLNVSYQNLASNLIQTDFETKRPYNYLQFCAFKVCCSSHSV